MKTICVYTIIGFLLVPFLSGEKLQKERKVYETQYATSRVKRNIQVSENVRDWQWYLKDTRVSMDVESAWDTGYTGKGVLVAVVDDGVNMNHPDLRSNFREDVSYDFMKNLNVNKYYSPGSHGTNCAGIIAGGNNANCGVGIAHDAEIASLRIFNDRTKSTDSSEARALSYKSQLVDIYSNSWGPGDIGWEVEGPGPRLTKVLEDGTKKGRGGKGSIFVFAAGNGGDSGDSCAFNGYVNNIHTIAISGVNWDGAVPGYTEKCAAIMAVTYGKDTFSYRTDGYVKPPLITTEGASGCTESFTGTSGTTAIASGIIALALEAKQHLTWRDIQHLIVRSSQPLDPPPVGRYALYWRPRPTWRINGANVSVSKYFGFGLMNAELMTRYAKDWFSVPEQLSCEIRYTINGSAPPLIPSTGDLKLTFTADKQNCGIRFLEHVQVNMNLTFPGRGHLEMTSKSPSGTKSQLLYPRFFDSFSSRKNLTNWNVTSLHYWGENPTGDWNITIRSTQRRWNRGNGRIFSLTLFLFGTRDDPLTNNRHVDRNIKRVKTVDIEGRKRDIPVHGGWQQWNPWSACSKRCEGGIKTRSRTCSNPQPANGGRGCAGNRRDSQPCNTHSCPVDGGYSSWGTWSMCSRSCGVGSQQRSRTCTNPAPKYGGRTCYQQRWRLGRARDWRRCNTNVNCPVDGRYSSWGTWSMCSRTCGGGYQSRSRTCTNPAPKYGGRTCYQQRRLGQAREGRRCNSNVNCPVDGGYSSWGTWSMCNTSCGMGFQSRSRTCTNPTPKYRGRTCQQRRLGEARESRACNTNVNCPENEGYTPWSPWSKLSATCGEKTQFRKRFCINIPSGNGGTSCKGKDEDTQRRTVMQICPPVCKNEGSDDFCDKWVSLCSSNKQFANFCKKSCNTCRD